MSWRRLTGFFLLRFLVIYTLLMIPWPGVRDACRALFIGGGRVVFESFPPLEGIRFETVDDSQRKVDTRIYVLHRQARAEVWMEISSRHVAYLPVVTLTSLVLATPISWRRRGRGLFWGLVLVSVFIGLRLAIILLYGFSQELPGTMAAQPDFWERTVRAGVKFITVGQGISYIVPVLVWILVLLRREDLQVIRSALAPCSGKSHKAKCVAT